MTTACDCPNCCNCGGEGCGCSYCSSCNMCEQCRRETCTAFTVELVRRDGSADSVTIWALDEEDAREQAPPGRVVSIKPEGGPNQ